MGLALKSIVQKNDTDSECKAMVIGLGETGLSVAEHLGQRSISFMMLDTRENPPQLAAFKKRFPDVTK